MKRYDDKILLEKKQFLLRHVHVQKMNPIEENSVHASFMGSFASFASHVKLRKKGRTNRQITMENVDENQRRLRRRYNQCIVSAQWTFGKMEMSDERL